MFDRTRVLFLDIDGVLNSTPYLLKIAKQEEKAPTEKECLLVAQLRSHLDYAAYPDGMILSNLRNLDPKALKLLNKVTSWPDVAVVVSSVWRLYYTTRGLQILLESKGFTGRVIGKTPELRGDNRRGDEIQQWLDAYHEPPMAVRGPFGAESVAILDDDAILGPWQARLVRTSMKTGLNALAVRRVLEMLENPIG